MSEEYGYGYGEGRQAGPEAVPAEHEEHAKIAAAVLKALEERDSLTAEERQYLREEIARRQRWHEMRRKITTNAIGGLVITSLVAIYNLFIHPVVYQAGSAVVDFIQRKWGVQ